MFPQYSKLDFYLTGESVRSPFLSLILATHAFLILLQYAGHYLPAIAYKIIQGNANEEGDVYINFQARGIEFHVLLVLISCYFCFSFPIFFLEQPLETAGLTLTTNSLLMLILRIPFFTSRFVIHISFFFCFIFTV